jgi:hypothetical protein
MKKILCQFIPIFVIFALLTRFKTAIKFSNTIVGKFIAIAIIIYYVSIDKIIGLFACSLIILFYQMDYIGASEHMMNLDNAYETPKQYELNTNSNSVDEFRKTNCDKNTLKYKDMAVRNDMAEHIFPGLQFTNETCNPCSNTCSISIIESKMATETAMIPINTNM